MSEVPPMDSQTEKQEEEKTPPYKVERGVRLERSLISNNNYNPNRTTDRQQEAIGESLRKYGQLTGVLVRPDPDNKGKYIIIDGEHRGRELEEYIYADIVHGLTVEDAQKLTIIMNETRGEADKVDLALLLNELNQKIPDVAELQVGLPYQLNELQELIDMGKVDWDSFNNDGDGDYEEVEDEPDEWISIACRIPKESLEALNSVIDLIKDEVTLNKDKAIANGQVLEILVAEYLSYPEIDESE